MKRPILGVTMGDPAGVGPEIIARALAEPAVIASSRPVVIGSAAIMKEALGLVGSPLALHVVRGIADSRWAAQTLECLDLGNVEAATLPRGEVSAAAGRAAYDYIERAIRLAQAGEIHGIVTAPVNKEAILRSGKSSKDCGTSTTVPRSNASNARRATKSVPRRRQVFARSAARTSICGIIK